MKKTTQIKAIVLTLLIGVVGTIFIAADHIDAPAVKKTTADISDFYAFEGATSTNLVLVGNTQGLLSPAATATATFDENVLIEFNIDNNGDNVEDLVIQAIPRDGKMYFFGPVKPTTTGLSSTVMKDNMIGSVDITKSTETTKTATKDGISMFAGPRDDPFFFDFTQFNKILNADDTTAGFNNPGTDTFKGTNVMSVVIELPKSMLSPGTDGKINVWLETKKK